MNIFRTISCTVEGDGPAVEEDGQASSRLRCSRGVRNPVITEGDGLAIPIPLEAPTDKDLHKPYNIR